MSKLGDSFTRSIKSISSHSLTSNVPHLFSYPSKLLQSAHFQTKVPLLRFAKGDAYRNDLPSKWKTHSFHRRVNKLKVSDFLLSLLVKFHGWPAHNNLLTHLSNSNSSLYLSKISCVISFMSLIQELLWT